MAKACKYCPKQSSYICDGYEDCDTCGHCKHVPMSKEDKENSQ